MPQSIVNKSNQEFWEEALCTLRAVLEGDLGVDELRIDALPRIGDLRQMLGLSEQEIFVLLVCLAFELDHRFSAVFEKVSGFTFPTYTAVRSLFPDGDWNFFSAQSPLRYWQLINMHPGESLMTSRLQLDERILQHLLGMEGIDQRLVGIIYPLEPHGELSELQWQLVKNIATVWGECETVNAFPIVHLRGNNRLVKKSIAAAVCQAARMPGYCCEASALPTDRQQLHQLALLWQRECILAMRLLFLDANEPAFAALIDQIEMPLVISSDQAICDTRRSIYPIDVPQTQSHDQYLLWKEATDFDPPFLKQIAAQFCLPAATIRSIGMGRGDEKAVWAACRLAARKGLEDLAQRIESKVGWGDLILPDQQLKMLKMLVDQAQCFSKVYHEWGFADKSTRGLNISALFYGPSGTGKTLAAEVVANALNLDLYRIDLSCVVSKYIGDTEANLRRVFDAADASGAVLLFDEADALFGKRSEVKDSHDRHANIEVGYLLQRLESYRGIAILTTNMKSALDQAFLRRLRFMIDFPFPDYKQRLAIWQASLPESTPVAGLDITLAAKLKVSGGSIRNIALNAAFLAAKDDQPVTMVHLLEAARLEYHKLEKALSVAEVAGWI